MNEYKVNEIVPALSEYDILIEEILQLELEIAALAEEIDDLENHVCVELRADYDQKVGNLEYQAQAYRLEISRLKRAIELLQAAINRQEAAKYEEVQEKVEQEYKQYEEELNKKAEEMKRDKEYKERRAKQDQKNEERAKEEQRAREEGKDSREKAEDTGSDNDSEVLHESPKEELKRLYRQIAKKLHPDANPDATDKELELFRKATKAYAEGDLETLREIAEQVDDTDIKEKYSDNLDDIAKLREIKIKLAEKVVILKAHIDDIKNSFPYTEMEFLADNDAVKVRKEELEEYNRQCVDKIFELQNKILELSKIADKNQKESEVKMSKQS